MRNVPVRLTPRIRSQLSGVSSSLRTNLPTPAQFTSSSGRPRSFATVATVGSTDDQSLTSQPYARAVCPSDSI